MKKVWIFSIIILASFGQIDAQNDVQIDTQIDEKTESSELWSLEKCIRYALENNLQVKQYEITTSLRSIS